MYKKGQLDFNIDIHTGEQGEAAIKAHLETLGFNFISDNKDYRYDLLMEYGDKNYTYEIKTDTLIAPGNDTGNIAIEYTSRGKSSGIDVTEADYFVYFLANFGEAWNIKTSKLKRLISENNFRKVPGGDKGSETWMYLIPRKKFIQHFKIHKI
jgi:hypothetical protein